MSHAASQHAPLQPALEAFPEGGATARFLGRKVGLPLAAVGALGAIAAGALDLQAFLFSYLVAYLFVWGIVLGSLFFIALQHITHAVWSVILRRPAELLASAMPLMAVLFLPILLLAQPAHLYVWMDGKAVSNNAILAGKTAYLNYGFFALRAVLYFTVWIFFARFFVGASLRQDRGEADAVALTRRMRKGSIFFLLLFPFTATFAAFDWVMSLQPLWFSTIFGIYIFAGFFVASLATLTLLLLWLNKRGLIGHRELRPDHLYSLGGFLFAFSCFWAYIAMSQLLLIWYANLPEETFWYVDRWHGGWKPLGIALIFLRFVVPFFGLMSIYAKKSTRALAAVSVVILVGQLADLFWLIVPELRGGSAWPLWQCLAGLALCGGLLLAWGGRFLEKHHAVAVGDPLLERSRQFHL